MAALVVVQYRRHGSRLGVALSIEPAAAGPSVSTPVLFFFEMDGLATLLQQEGGVEELVGADRGPFPSHAQIPKGPAIFNKLNPVEWLA